MNTYLLSLILSTAVLAGCETASPGISANHPTDPSKVVILKQKPNVPYDELGKISASETYMPEGPASALTMSGGDVISDLRDHGAKLGADAVILTGKEIIPPMDSGQSSRMFVSGIAIKYKRGSLAASQ